MADKLPAPLPDGVRPSDLKYPSQHAEHLYKHDFDLWYVGGTFGWVVPTLGISNGRGGYAPRTYAISITNGKPCRVGLGPHVQARLKVYVTKNNEARLRPIIELRGKGEVIAHTTRDRISTRRMRSALGGW